MDLDDFLEHYGIKGMRWGVRRTKQQLSSEVSPDAKKAADIQSKIKTGGTKALSNQDLQAVVTRMRLEQQYSQVAGPQTGKGKKFVKELLINTGKQQASKAANDAAAKAVAQGMAKAVAKKAAKEAAGTAITAATIAAMRPR